MKLLMFSERRILNLQRGYAGPDKCPTFLSSIQAVFTFRNCFKLILFLQVKAASLFSAARSGGIF